MKDSKIEWLSRNPLQRGHTFNPWMGCVKVSPACERCYAEAMATRFWEKKHGKLWGADSTRWIKGDAVWKEPLKWDRASASKKGRASVFCLSMGDIFEDRRDLDAPRERVWKLITETPNLDWQLLTKRPENIGKLGLKTWPTNVWLGCTVEDQKRAEQRIPHLLKNKASVRWIICEPLLGPVDLSKWIDQLDWVLAGGESGGGSRPMQIEWARSVRDQCIAAEVPFFFKQWGNHTPNAEGELIRLRSPHGRFLDGQKWDQFPNINNKKESRA